MGQGGAGLQLYIRALTDKTSCDSKLPSASLYVNSATVGELVNKPGGQSYGESWQGSGDCACEYLCVCVCVCVRTCVCLCARVCVCVSLWTMPRHAETWPGSMRGAFHPGPENTLLPCHWRSAQCRRSGEKWTETKRDQSFVSVRQRRALQTVFQDSSTWRRRERWREDVLMSSDVKRLWHSQCGHMISPPSLLDTTTYSILTSVTPPHCFQSHWHICRHSDRLCLFICAQSKRFPSKYILFPHFYSNLDWMVWNENVHFASTAHLLPLSLPVWK